MKLFVPFATSDNGVYICEEKGAEVALARSQHRKLRRRMAITARANRFSRHDVNYYTSPRYPRYPSPLSLSAPSLRQLPLAVLSRDSR